MGQPAALPKTPLFEWTRTGLVSADGSGTWNVPVDNYEGMALVPSSSTKSGQYLLLVNDDNGNNNQIGTQLVLLRLVEAMLDPIDADESADADRAPFTCPSLVVLAIAIATLLVGRD